MDITSLIGTHVVFDYPAAFDTLADYSCHRGQVVLVLREVDPTEADGPAQGVEQMYWFRAADGWEGYAYVSELSTPGAITPELCGSEELRLQEDAPAVPTAVLLELPLVTQEERDALLAGLRLLQSELSHELDGDPLMLDIYSNGGRHAGLSADGVDRLCEKLNA